MKAYELLEKPESWCQGTLARKADGTCTYSYASDAVAWCLAGALYKVSSFADAVDDAEKKIQDEIGTLFLGKWNDDPSRKHEEVVALLRKLDL